MIGRGPRKLLKCSDGAPLNPTHYPIGAIEGSGAVLFADLPGYSTRACELSPVECAALTSLYFAWFEGEALSGLGGFVDKYIGDEVMVVFLDSVCSQGALQCAMRAAVRMLSCDPYAFAPKIGIAAGDLAVAWVGTYSNPSVTVVGRTVNLAARCVDACQRERQVRIATADRNAVCRVFDDTNAWSITEVEEFRPKNMAVCSTVTVQRKTLWIPGFDVVSGLRDYIDLARREGAIIAQPSPDDRPLDPSSF